MSETDIVTVVGLGKIGLPLAVQFARSGFKVYGADISLNVVQKVNEGEAPFPGEEKLADFLKEVTEKGSLSASTDITSCVAISDVVVVVVPLYVDGNGEPDFKSIDLATDKIGAGLVKNTLVSYETTLPIGTTRNRFAKALESKSGLIAGRDFQVVFSPERVFTGRVFEDLKKYPKLVGGIDLESEARGVSFYNRAIEFVERPDLPKANGVWQMGSSEAAEFAKLAETTYRDVNIALANQFALYANENKINVHDVISASNSQPFSHIHQPGIAVGGHCIPIYPQMYLWGDPQANLVKVARNLNDSMPQKSVDRLEALHGSLENQTVVILGASYRGGGVKETAFSGVFPIASSLIKKGAKVTVYDSKYSADELSILGLSSHVLGTPVDAIIVQSDDTEFKSLTKEVFPSVRTVFDGRSILDKKLWPGVNFHVLGNGA